MKIPSNWTFENKEVAENFNNHVREQLPWYDLATQAVIHLSRHYIPNNGLVYDLGASTGNIGNAIKDILTTRNAEFVAIENSKEMIDMYQCDYGELVHQDINKYSYSKYDLCIAFLTFMFVDTKYRESLLDRLYANCQKGGAIIIFDKMESIGGYLGTINYRLTLAEKVKTVKDYKEIIDKELSLQGVQRPLSHDLLTKYNPTLFFKFSDFVGYVIEK